MRISKMLFASQHFVSHKQVLYITYIENIYW